MYLAPAGGFRGGTVGECRGKGRSLSCLPFRLSGPRASLVGRGWFSPTVTRFLCLTVFRPRLAHLAAAGSVVASLRSGRNARPRVARWYSRVVLRPPRPPPWQLCCRAAKLEMALSIAGRSAASPVLFLGTPGKPRLNGYNLEARAPANASEARKEPRVEHFDET